MNQQELMRVVTILEPLHIRMGAPAPDDWLANQPETGQTFLQYTEAKPVLPTTTRRTLYVLPVGEFSPGQDRILQAAVEYLGAFYSLPVKILPKIRLSSVPSWARRAIPSYAYPEEWNQHVETMQYHSGYIMQNVLKPRLPTDAAALIAFTSLDLWPGGGWNYVFGQASTTERLGVWSLFRFGDPDAGPSQYRLCLLRTLKLASHETGHMFSMQHCTKYECNMSGTNHLGETDRRPLDACPECVAKVCWMAGYNPEDRFRRLASFCAVHGLRPEREFLAKSLNTLAGK